MYYETIFVVSPDVSQENTQELIDALIVRVEKASGRIVKREYWGVRPLAYQIGKRKRGHYILLVTDGEPEASMALEQALRLEERVLRFLTTRLQELSDTPSPLMPRKAVEPVEAEAQDGDSDTAEASTSPETPAEAQAATSEPVASDTAAEKTTAEGDAAAS